MILHIRTNRQKPELLPEINKKIRKKKKKKKKRAKLTEDDDLAIVSLSNCFASFGHARLALCAVTDLRAALPSTFPPPSQRRYSTTTRVKHI